MTTPKYDLEERLIDFAIIVSDIVEGLPATRIGNYIAGQLIRSGLNYGEAQSAESRNAFIHKMKVILKELRESLISLKITERKALYNMEKVAAAKNECNQLVAIFVKSIETTKKNNIK
jgi:four helix bundle protein